MTRTMNENSKNKKGRHVTLNDNASVATYESNYFNDHPYQNQERDSEINEREESSNYGQTT